MNMAHVTLEILIYIWYCSTHGWIKYLSTWVRILFYTQNDSRRLLGERLSRLVKPILHRCGPEIRMFDNARTWIMTSINNLSYPSDNSSVNPNYLFANTCAADNEGSNIESIQDSVFTENSTKDPSTNNIQSTVRPKSYYPTDFIHGLLILQLWVAS